LLFGEFICIIILPKGGGIFLKQEKPGDYIRKIRKEVGLTLTELSEKSGISSSHLSRIERNERKVTFNIIQSIAPYLNTTPLSLLKETSPYYFNEVDSEEEKQFFTGSQISDEDSSHFVLSKNQIPIFNQDDDYFEKDRSPQRYEDISNKNIIEEDYFYLKISNNSMKNNRIKESDLALIHKQSKVDEGKVAAVYINELNRLKVRKIYYSDKKIILEAANPEYPLEFYTQKEIKIVGQVEEVKFSL
jgi:SOS-response transcriptional repressor LexA